MPLFGTSPQHQYWLCTGSDGLIGAAAAWALHVFSWSVTSRLVLWPWLGAVSRGSRIVSVSAVPWRGAAHWLAYTALLDLALVAHARTMLTDPGAVPPGSKPTARAMLGYLEHGCVITAASKGEPKLRSTYV